MHAEVEGASEVDTEEASEGPQGGQLAVDDKSERYKKKTLIMF